MAAATISELPTSLGNGCFRGAETGCDDPPAFAVSFIGAHDSIWCRSRSGVAGAARKHHGTGQAHFFEWRNATGGPCLLAEREVAAIG
ncbi:hypothetical protein D3C73_1443830 [compost metagenome]